MPDRIRCAHKSARLNSRRPYNCQVLPVSSMEMFFGERITVQALYPLVLGVTDDETVKKGKMACPFVELVLL